MIPGSKVVALENIQGNQFTANIKKDTVLTIRDMGSGINFLSCGKVMGLRFEEIRNLPDPRYNNVEWMYVFHFFREIEPPKDAFLVVNEGIANEDVVNTPYYSEQPEMA